MELGGEWVLPEMMAKLVCLSMDHNACWMDQLCISQKGESIRRTLASIATIYRTLPVVALLPGRPCRCLHRELEGMERAYQRGLGAMSMQKFTADHGMRDCYNAYGINSWFNRIWTRQELLYSRTIQVEWVSDEEPECVKVDTNATEGMAKLMETLPSDEECDRKMQQDIHKLSPYLALMFGKSWMETGSYTAAFKKAHPISAAFFSSGLCVIGDYTGHGGESGIEECYRTLDFLRFMAGIPMHKHISQGQIELERFLHEMGGLCVSPRAATQPRDYVISVWVDCPGYVLPEGYKTMPLGDLLEDAIIQLERNHGVSLITTTPAGLFQGATQATGLWRPSKYLNSIKVTGSHQVYGSLVHPFRQLTLTRADTIPLNTFVSDAISSRAYAFTIVCKGQKTSDLFKLVSEVWEDFPTNTFHKYLLAHIVSMEEKETVDRLGTEGIIFVTLIIENTLSRQPASPFHHGSWPDGLMEFNPEAIVFNMVTTLLGLNPDFCRTQGMVLMLALDKPTAFGLVTRHFYHWRNRHPEEAKRRVRTISLDNPPCFVGKCNQVLHEVVQGSQRSGKATFKVVGVWCPVSEERWEWLLQRAQGNIIDGQRLEIV